MKRAVAIAAMLGVAIPLVLFSAMQWTGLLDELPEQIILSVWPTYFFLLGFSGPLNSAILIAVAVAAAVNGAIYALVVFLICLITRCARPMPSNHQFERDA
jgi:hypothetical protein